MGGPQRKRPMVGGQRGCTPPTGLRSTGGRIPGARQHRGYEEKAGVEVAPEGPQDWGRAMEEGRCQWSSPAKVQMWEESLDISLLALGGPRRVQSWTLPRTEGQSAEGEGTGSQAEKNTDLVRWAHVCPHTEETSGPALHWDKHKCAASKPAAWWAGVDSCVPQIPMPPFEVWSGGSQNTRQ